jgi:hypothetical protein
MARINTEKTISANSNGIVISYGDANKHQFMRYERTTPAYVKKIQIEGTAKYQKIEEEVKLSPKQKDMYSKLVYGFKAYTKEEIASMSEKKKIDVTVRYTKAQRILRNWKQDLTFSFIDNLLSALFPKSPITKAMCETKGHIDNVDKEEEISFKDLGINQQQIINKLIEFGLLPKNFYQLV